MFVTRDFCVSVGCVSIRAAIGHLIIRESKGFDSKLTNLYFQSWRILIRIRNMHMGFGTEHGMTSVWAN